MRGEFLVMLALSVAASCGGQTLEDEPPVNHVPSNDASFDASVTPSWDAAAEPHLEAASDSVAFDVGLVDPSNDASMDSAEPPLDAADALPLPEACEPLGATGLACGAAECVTPHHLDYWAVEDGGCCVMARKCLFGCVAYPGGACCAAPPLACQSGKIYTQGSDCFYQESGLCFASFEEACACRNCPAGTTCDLLELPGKLKLPGGTSWAPEIGPACATSIQMEPVLWGPQRVTCVSDAGASDAGASD